MSIRSLVALIVLCFMVACSPITVKRTGGSSYDLTGYTSYRWNLAPLDDPGKYARNAVALDQAMRNAVSVEMGARGFQKKVFNEAADLVFDYRLQLKPEEYAKGEPQDYGLVWKRGKSGEVEMHQNRPMGNPDVVLDRAYLLLTVYNGNKSEILWEVTADRLLEGGSEPENLNANVARAMAKIFKSFPAGQ